MVYCCSFATLGSLLMVCMPPAACQVEPAGADAAAADDCAPDMGFHAILQRVPGHVEPIVIAGLAPAIHPFRKKMDARVKPAHDGGEQRFNSSGLPCKIWLHEDVNRKETAQHPSAQPF